MNGTVELLGLSTDGVVTFGWTMAARGAALLCVALGVAALLRRAPAALRHHVWTLAMVGLVALPALVLVAPPWRVAVPGADALDGLLARSSVARDLVGTRSARGDAEGTTAWSAPVESARLDGRASSAEDASASPGAAIEPVESSVPLSWPFVLAGIWAVGFLLLFVRLAAGVVRAMRLVRRAEPVTDRRWNVLVSSLCLKSGLDTDVRVVSSPEVGVPMAWGVLGAWLVLPEGIESWPEDRRRVVVLHELAHLRRRDCASQALARFALALHWPNPLAWLAVRRMRSERERACDDAVLAAGVGGPAYAHHLVDIARGISPAFRPARAAVAMARASELENRVLAILDPRRSRRGVGRRAARIGLGCLVVFLVPVATIHPMAADPPVESAENALPVPALERAPAGPVDAEPEVPVAGRDERSGDGSAGSNVEDESGSIVEEAVGEAADEATGARDDAGEEIGADPGVLAALDARMEALAGDGLVAADTIEERVFQALLRALESEDAEVRRRIAHTFGQIESARAVEPLSDLVRTDPDAGVREQAAWALGMIESEGAVDALAEAVADDAGAVREQAVWALGMIESARGVPPLIPVLGDPDPEVRNQAAWALGMIESAEAVEALGRAFGSEADAGVRAQIIWALGMIEDRDALDTVVDALEDDAAEVRDQALWALGMIMG